MTQIFDGQALADQLEKKLAQQVAQWGGGPIKIAAIVFREDAGGQLYTAKKTAAARRVGMIYEAYSFSLLDPIERVGQKLTELTNDQSVTGIIIQKPTRQNYNVQVLSSLSAETKNSSARVGESAQAKSIPSLSHSSDHLEGQKQIDLVTSTNSRLSFDNWWQSLVEMIAPEKDVDGLSPTTAMAISDGSWKKQGRVLPATVRAVYKIITTAGLDSISSRPPQTLILGRSDLLGQPLFNFLNYQHWPVQLWGRREIEQWQETHQPLPAQLIITATGQAHLISARDIQPHAALIDVGEPNPDVSPDVVGRASFLTPVPRGVGPLTVISLLENAWFLSQKKTSSH